MWYRASNGSIRKLSFDTYELIGNEIYGYNYNAALSEKILIDQFDTEEEAEEVLGNLWDRYFKWM